MAEAKYLVAWQPQKSLDPAIPGPQELLISCPLGEVFYGGAAGGGKTDGLIGDFTSGIELYGDGWHGIIFRKSFPRLEQIEKRTLEIYGPLYGVKCYNRANHEWRFPNGASLKLRYIEDDADIWNYHGQEYTWVGWDELTEWASDYCYTFMFSRLRSAKGIPCFMRATSNPGGPGHGWVKARFIDPAPPLTIIKDDRGDRVFIPARIEDNLILMRNDPHYEQRLLQMSDPVMRKALREGLWDIFQGQAFPEWNPRIHICDNHTVPTGAEMWRSLDWGFRKPFCCLWAYSNFDGDIIISGELYGWNGKANEGNQEPAAAVLAKIQNIEQEHNWWVQRGYLDPQCWAKEPGQQSVFEMLGGAKLRWEPWPKGPGSRVNQKQAVHDALKVVNGQSRLRIMRRCTHLLRTLPILPVDPKKPEDVDTHAEDHAYDALRGLLTRKILTRQERQRVEQLRQMTGQPVEYGRFGGW